MDLQKCILCSEKPEGTRSCLFKFICIKVPRIYTFTKALDNLSPIKASILSTFLKVCLYSSI